MGDILDNIDFTVQDIEEAISEQCSSSSAGPDGIPAILLKSCKKDISYPVQSILKRSPEEGRVLRSTKTGIITPIHKGGSRGDPAKYRPVTLTSFVIKLFEKVVRKKLVKFFSEKGLFTLS